MVAVRLSDVASDGRATRISYGLLNLTHRADHDRPEALAPGQRYQVSVTLNAMAQAIPPGHRLRLALSTSYWPLAWPPPQPVRLTVYPAASTLVLPPAPRSRGRRTYRCRPSASRKGRDRGKPPSSSRPGNAGP